MISLHIFTAVVFSHLLLALVALALYCEITRSEFEADPNACGPQRTPETYDAAVADLQAENIQGVRGIKVAFLLHCKYE
ncbi:hypothetical protein PFLUV_G00052840 [Perca fluviatilis]|uniref:Uncharacterized protein n=1 Tax=Perca fluviatilis TaxID=8168 RepID=A0A6A5EKW8_PERFL|nr:hypothetical protein PFLUV_G00052840 [Perca fluviatilis]